VDTKKYIIEIPDNTAWLQWVKVSDKDGHVYFDFKDPEDLTPYTEPRKESCDKGMNEAEDLAYQLYSVKVDEAYQRGLNDAWDAARKIAKLDTDEQKRLFGCFGIYFVAHEFSASEAIDKIRQYEQKQEKIKVGDEVISDEDIKGVTVDMDDYLLHVLDENGVIQAWPREDVVKTGRNFPEIAEVLKKMQEG
jgi:hypothetical protein